MPASRFLYVPLPVFLPASDARWGAATTKLFTNCFILFAKGKLFTKYSQTVALCFDTP